MRKRIFFTVAIISVFSLQAFAQSDGFFNEWKGFDNREIIGGDMPNLPGVHGVDYDQDAPLGAGLLILTALGAGYAAVKRKDER